MTTATAQVIDESQIGGLAEAAGVDGVNAILEAFWTSCDELADSLTVALSSSDTDEAAKLGHALKGSSANLGAALMASRAQAIETAAKDGDMAAALSALDAFRNDIAQTRETIEMILVRYA